MRVQDSGGGGGACQNIFDMRTEERRGVLSVCRLIGPTGFDTITVITLRKTESQEILI